MRRVGSVALAAVLALNAGCSMIRMKGDFPSYGLEFGQEKVVNPFHAESQGTKVETLAEGTGISVAAFEEMFITPEVQRNIESRVEHCITPKMISNGMLRHCRDYHIFNWLISAYQGSSKRAYRYVHKVLQERFPRYYKNRE